MSNVYVNPESSAIWRYVPVSPHLNYRDAEGDPITYQRFLALVQTPNYSTLYRTELPDGVLRTDWIGFDSEWPARPVNVIETVYYTFGSNPEVRVLGKDACADDAAIRHDYWTSVLVGP